MATLIESAAGLPFVSCEVAEEYDRKGRFLIEAVNGSMGGHPSLAVFLGGNPLSVMEANHVNHQRFMVNVFKLNDYELLASLLPWVYRAYHAHGLSYDYFPAELAAWIVACETHLTPAAAAAVRPAYDWMVRVHPETILASEIPPSVPAGPFPPEARKLLNHLLTGDDRECLAAARIAVRDGETLKGYYMNGLQPALYEVGRLWERGEISTAQEHLASSITARIMASLYAHVIPPRGTSPGKALISCAPNEYHELGARMLADMLELDGWRTWYLGASTPIDDILAFLASEKPDLLCLSVCIPYSLDKAWEVIRKAREIPGLSHLKVLVGGQAFFYSSALWEKIGADAFAPDADAGVALARQLVSGCER